MANTQVLADKIYPVWHVPNLLFLDTSQLKVSIWIPVKQIDRFCFSNKTVKKSIQLAI